MINVVGKCVFITPDLISNPSDNSSCNSNVSSNVLKDSLDYFYTFTDFIACLNRELDELNKLSTKKYNGYFNFPNSILNEEEIKIKINEIKIQIKIIEDLRFKFLYENRSMLDAN